MRWLWNKWRWLAEAALFAVKIWLVLDWSLPGSDLAALQFGTAEYVAAIVFIGACAVAVVWEPINSTLPRSKFGNEYSRIVKARDLLGRSVRKEVHTNLVYQTVGELVFVLDDLKIKGPKFKLNESKNRTRWQAYLTRLAVHAEKKQLKKARALGERTAAGDDKE